MSGQIDNSSYSKISLSYDVIVENSIVRLYILTNLALKTFNEIDHWIPELLDIF